jgi:putative oxidoreductase
MNTLPVAHSLGLLLLRLAISGFMLVHGIQKLQSYATLVDKFPDPLGLGSKLSLIAAIGAEVGCSVLLILGLCTRLATLPLAFTMAIALFVIHAADPWQVKELAAVYLAVYLALFLTGAGRYSLDAVVWRPKPTAADVVPPPRG